MATAYARRQFSGGAIVTAVPLGVGSSDGSFTLAASTNWPDGSVGNFIVVLDFGNSAQEKVLCSSRSGLVVTVAASGRGYDGTSAVGHSAGVSIQVCHGAQDDDEANQLVSLMGNGAEGSLFYGKGATTLPAKLAIDATSGHVLSSNGTDPVWQYPALTNASGSIPTNVSIGASANTDILTTASLAIGTWLVTFGMTFFTPGATGAIELYPVVVGATATFTGNQSAGMSVGTGNETAEEKLNIAFIATVTVAGTIKFTVNNSCSATGNALADTAVMSGGAATGYTAVRIA